MNCLFCKIASHELDAHIIYEDDLVLAFLDINPISPGHTLIIPKAHFLDLAAIDQPTLDHLMMVAKKINIVIKEKLNINGLRLVQNNGFFQEVPHFHLHLIPHYQEKPTYSLEQIKSLLKQSI